MTFIALSFILFGLLLVLSSIENESIVNTLLLWTGKANNSFGGNKSAST